MNIQHMLYLDATQGNFEFVSFIAFVREYHFDVFENWKFLNPYKKSFEDVDFEVFKALCSYQCRMRELFNEGDIKEEELEMLYQKDEAEKEEYLLSLYACTYGGEAIGELSRHHDFFNLKKIFSLYVEYFKEWSEDERFNFQVSLIDKELLLLYHSKEFTPYLDHKFHFVYHLYNLLKFNVLLLSKKNFPVAMFTKGQTLDNIMPSHIFDVSTLSIEINPKFKVLLEANPNLCNVFSIFDLKIQDMTQQLTWEAKNNFLFSSLENLSNDTVKIYNTFSNCHIDINPPLFRHFAFIQKLMFHLYFKYVAKVDFPIEFKNTIQKVDNKEPDKIFISLAEKFKI